MTHSHGSRKGKELRKRSRRRLFEAVKTSHEKTIGQEILLVNPKQRPDARVQKETSGTRNKERKTEAAGTGAAETGDVDNQTKSLPVGGRLTHFHQR